MSNIRMCIGSYAQTPYYYSDVCMNIYSIEELCYLFVLNPFVINVRLMSDELVEFIDKELNISDLAESLRRLRKKGAQLSEFVTAILDYTKFCDEDELKSIIQTIQSNVGLSEFAQKKNQADYLVRNKRYESAIEEYEKLLNILPDVESEIKPKIYHNIAYAYSHMFMFEIAAKYFKRAYDLSKDKNSGLLFLSSLRMSLSDDRYLSFVSEHTEYYELSLMLEKRMRLLEENYEGSQESIMLNALNIYKDEGNVSSYYDEIDKVINGLKEDYLSQIS